MKKTWTSLLLAAVLLLSFSCNDDDDTSTRGNASILSYSIQGLAVTFVIDQNNFNITNVEPLPDNLDVTELVAEFELTEDARAFINTVEQESGVTPNNFTNKVSYLVESGDRQLEREYDVILRDNGTTGGAGEAAITAYDIPELNVDFTIDEATGMITHAGELPMGTDVGALIAVFSFSNGASVQVSGFDQVSGVTVNDFTDPVVYTVTSEDMTLETEYTVKVVVSDTPVQSWSEVTPDGGFLAFQDQRAGILNGEVYVMGTASVAVGGPNFQEVWKSFDGATWNQVGTMPDIFPPYGFSELLTFNNAFHLIGGATLPDFNGGGSVFTATAQNAVSTSSNGSDWTENAGLAFTARAFYRGAVFNNEMYITAGNNLASGIPNSASTDVWKSSDGIDWNLVTDAPGFEARSTPAVFVHDGKLWVTGGGGLNVPGPEDLYNDVWFTEDGSNWTQVNVTAPYPARTGHNAISYNGNMYVLFGNDNPLSLADKTFYSDIWMSDDDGATWSEVTGGSATPGGFAPRGGASVLVDGQNMVWVIGGLNTGGPLKDVWRGSL
ncbi:MAG: DUF6242 domain-containing protein [Bacteroidota bacterium]